MQKRIVAALAAVIVVLTGATASAAPAQAVESGWGTVAVPAEQDLTKGLPKIPQASKADKRITKNMAKKGQVKYLPPARPGTPSILVGETRDYAVASLGLNNTGAWANLDISNPGVHSADNGGTGLVPHSLAEISVQDGTNNIAEFGWIKRAGDSAPSLFGYTWNAGSGNGYGTGWTDYAANTTYNLGTTLTTSVTKKVGLQWDGATECGAVDGAWWASYDNTWVAFYCGNQFTSGGLRTGAANFDQWFFEKVYDTTRGFGCSDLGDGDLASVGAAGIPSIGFWGSMQMIGQPTSLPTFAPLIRTIPASPPFGAHTVNAASNRTWYGGGPGPNSTNTAIGSKGAC